MTIQFILSLCAFALFVGMVLVRASMMRKRGIRAMVFGQTDKSDYLLVPVILAIAYSALANTFGLPMWSILVRPFWAAAAPGWLGVVLCVTAVVCFAVTLKSFGDSFRVGIDENTPDKLVTGGVFAISRNPLYVCFLMFFTGLFLVHRNIVIAAAVVIFALFIHRQILREEKFLLSHYGKEYEDYRAKVRRYV